MVSSPTIVVLRRLGTHEGEDVSTLEALGEGGALAVHGVAAVEAAHGDGVALGDLENGGDELGVGAGRAAREPVAKVAEVRDVREHAVGGLARRVKHCKR